jgi:RNA polymerase sigma-70 factor, ECF subfamily
MGTLADAFLAVKPESGVDRQALEEMLCRCLDEGRRAWPGVELDPVLFVRHLAERSERTELEPELRAADLFLACACVHQVPAALESFAVHYLSRVPVFLARAVDAAAITDEVRQLLARRLFVGEGGGPGRIADYRGRGSLEGWVRAATARIALNLQRGERRHQRAAEKAAAEARLQPADPELDYLKGRYAPELRDALQAALASLPARDRTVLRLHFVERVGVGQLAASYAVHRATVGRWILAAQQALLDETRRRLRERLHLGATECESLMTFLRSRVDLTISRALESTPSRPRDPG